MQALALRSVVPDGRTSLTPRQLIWRGRVRPLLQSQTYELHLTARPARPPKVTVTAPALQPDGAGRLPHVYDDGSLCVSQFGDWQPHMLFTATFLPWSCEWLVYYELWLATGLWFGDGPDRLDQASQAQILHPFRA
ncbi:hypothetical protein [Micromonospora sp. NPDC049891]|uniref:hypothetical protein n=1 Tax=Micromonospora sp. NPDC049891 TaxID=3155655 RepID=UPI003410711F